MFEGDDNTWWVTGGYNGVASLSTTEIYNFDNNSFSTGPYLPTSLYNHNLVNVNNTHMVVLGGEFSSREIFILDKSVHKNVSLIFEF